MIRKSVADILDHHVTFELEAIDRMHLNGYVPSLQSGGGVVYFMKTHLGARGPSTLAVAPLTKRFVDAIERFAVTTGIDLITFEKTSGRTTWRRGTSPRSTATKASSSSARPKRRRRSSAPRSGAMPMMARPTPGSFGRRHRSIITTSISSTATSARCSSSSAHFPYAMKVCLNGHEWLKRQLTQRGIAYEPLDNGIRSTEDATRVQRIADSLDGAKIDAVLRKWLRRLPHVSVR
jgi:hypothetical protein